MGTQHKLVSVSSENNEYKINSQQTVFEEYKNDVGDDSECSYG